MIVLILIYGQSGVMVKKETLFSSQIEPAELATRIRLITFRSRDNWSGTSQNYLKSSETVWLFKIWRLELDQTGLK